jgi:hypothetical protein
MISKNINLVVNKRNENDFNEGDLSLAPDSYFNSIFVSDVLELSNNDDVMGNVIKKIKKNGTITFSGVDGLEACRKVFFGETPIEDASGFFGRCNRINSMTSIRTILEKNGLQIRFAGVDNGRYLVEAQKV